MDFKEEIKKVDDTLNMYFKVFLFLLAFAVLSCLLVFGSMTTALADETPSEYETLYSDGTLALLSDGTIVDLTETEPETENETETQTNENDVLSDGDSVPDPVYPETDEMGDEGSLPGETVSENTQNTEISDSNVTIYAGSVNLVSGSDGSDEEYSASLYSGDVISIPEDRCITYEVNFDGVSYTAVFPLSAADSLAVCDGILCNVGSSSVTGRLFKGSFDTGTYGERYVTLNSVLSTSGNNNAYLYDAWSYVTFYEPNESSGYNRLSSTNTYGNLYVVEEPKSFEEFETFEAVVTAFLLVIMVFQVIDTVRKEKRF